MPPKSKKLKPRAEESSENDSDSESNSPVPTEKINVEFEAYDIIESDLNGIRNLLHQLFLKANLNLTELSQLLVNQKDVGCIFKPTCVDEETPPDEKMETDDDEDLDIFGVVSVVNLSDSETELFTSQCVKDLRGWLNSQVKTCADADISRQLSDLLGANSQSRLGFIVNERLINIPCHIALPSFESLTKDMTKAGEANGKFNFDHFVFLLKLHKGDKPTGVEDRKRSKKKSASVAPDPVIYANPEEEFLMDLTQLSCDFAVGEETDSGLTGTWSQGDFAYKPYRRIVVIPADQMEVFVRRLKSDLSQQTV